MKKKTLILLAALTMLSAASCSSKSSSKCTGDTCKIGKRAEGPKRITDSSNHLVEVVYQD